MLVGRLEGGVLVVNSWVGMVCGCVLLLFGVVVGLVNVGLGCCVYLGMSDLEVLKILW